MRNMLVWPLLAIAGNVFAANFDECYDYNRLLDRHRSVAATVEGDPLIGKWSLEGKEVSCNVSSDGKVEFITVNGTVLKRSSMIKIAGPDAGKVEHSQDEDDAFVKQAKAALTRGLKDPSSVQWRDLGLAEGGLPMLCGEMNAKNSYGAYVGFKRFYYTGRSGFDAIEGQGTNGDPAIFLPTYQRNCSKLRVQIQN